LAEGKLNICSLCSVTNSAGPQTWILAEECSRHRHMGQHNLTEMKLPYDTTGSSVGFFGSLSL
jgi:hypothetical protein